jgi:phosphatidate phosphatase APP1
LKIQAPKRICGKIAWNIQLHAEKAPMSKWQKKLAPPANDVEEWIDRLKYRLADRLGSLEPVRLVPLVAFTHPGGLYLKGRALRQRTSITGADNDSLWDDLLDLYRRANSDEIPGARILAHAGGQTLEMRSDAEGYFELHLPGAAPDSVELESLPEPHRNLPAAPRTAVPLVQNARPARFGVISDIDDTLLVTNVQSLAGLARSLLSGRAGQRLPFPGAPALYRGLHQGSAPLFFVSSSPWNLLDLLDETFDAHGLPERVAFLRDWGISDQELLPTDNFDHKLGLLRQITGFFPDLPFLLIGDSGQQDPEIYASFVAENPGRVLAVYIRDVSPDPRRDAAVLALGPSGVPLLLAPASLAMARDAAARGWLDAAAVHEIEVDLKTKNFPD